LAQVAYTGSHVFNSDTFKNDLAQALGLASVTNSTVQNTLNRLAKRNILTAMEQGRYQFEDTAFAVWVKERKPDV